MNVLIDIKSCKSYLFNLSWKQNGRQPKGRRKKILLRFCPKKKFSARTKIPSPPPENQMDRALRYFNSLFATPHTYSNLKKENRNQSNIKDLVSCSVNYTNKDDIQCRKNVLAIRTQSSGNFKCLNTHLYASITVLV